LRTLTHSQFELMPIAVPVANVSELNFSSPPCLSAPTFSSGLQWQDLWHIHPRNAVHRSAVIRVSGLFEWSMSAITHPNISMYVNKKATLADAVAFCVLSLNCGREKLSITESIIIDNPRPNDPHIMGLLLPKRSRKTVGKIEPTMNIH